MQRICGKCHLLLGERRDGTGISTGLCRLHELEMLEIESLLTPSEIDEMKTIKKSSTWASRLVAIAQDRARAEAYVYMKSIHDPKEDKATADKRSQAAAAVLSQCQNIYRHKHGSKLIGEED